MTNGLIVISSYPFSPTSQDLVRQAAQADSPLYSLPNVILTPHIAGVTVHYDRQLAVLFADNLHRYRMGQPLRNRYDPERGY